MWLSVGVGATQQAGYNILEVYVQGPDQTSQRLVDLAQQATSAVLPGEAADLWSTAFKALSAQQLPLDGLLARFIRELSASAAGPLRVQFSLAHITSSLVMIFIAEPVRL